MRLSHAEFADDAVEQVVGVDGVPVIVPNSSRASRTTARGPFRRLALLARVPEPRLIPTVPQRGSQQSPGAPHTRGAPWGLMHHAGEP